LMTKSLNKSRLLATSIHTRTRIARPGAGVQGHSLEYAISLEDHTPVT
jgi:hypothetical protein